MSQVCGLPWTLIEALTLTSPRAHAVGLGLWGAVVDQSGPLQARKRAFLKFQRCHIILIPGGGYWEHRRHP